MSENIIIQEGGVGKTLNGIKITKNPDKTTYYSGNAVNMSGIIAHKYLAMVQMKE